MASILDLPDECLAMICKKLDLHDQQYRWSNVCKRFEYIYFQYFHNWTDVNDHLAQHYGHLIGTDDFPLRVIKRLFLTESKCTKYFLNKLRDCHKEIEEAELNSFTEEYMAELLPLPNLKKLDCVNCNTKGRCLIELNSLTDLRISSYEFFDPKYLLQITCYNPLRTLAMDDENVFSNRYAFEIMQNLKDVELLAIIFNSCKSWQLVGTLPKLKKLVISNLYADECETCFVEQNLFKLCEWRHATFFFDELCRRNQLEELMLLHSNLSVEHILRISELTNLKRLVISKHKKLHFRSLDMLKDLVNLEDLRIDNWSVYNAEDSLELIRCYKKLKVLLLCFDGGVTEYFLKEANDIVSRRQPTPLEPLAVGYFLNLEDLELILSVKPLPFLRFVRPTSNFGYGTAGHVHLMDCCDD